MERVDAIKLLRKVCEKHGIDPDSIDEEEEKEYNVRVPDELKWLYFRTISQVAQRDVDIWRTFKANRYIFKVTESEFVLINSMYDHYKKQLGKQLDILKDAFTIKHRIWSNHEKGSGKKMTAEEYAYLLRSMKMAEGMDSEGYIKRIG